MENRRRTRYTVDIFCYEVNEQDYAPPLRLMEPLVPFLLLLQSIDVLLLAALSSATFSSIHIPYDRPITKKSVLHFVTTRPSCDKTGDRFRILMYGVRKS